MSSHGPKSALSSQQRLPPGPRPEPRKAILGLLALFLVVVLCAATRIHLALSDPNFDTRSPDGMLRSDPALLYYITERIIESGGLPPEDFRADPRVQHPDLADLPAMLPVFQEFLVAWAYLLLGGGVPLHVFCIGFMGIVASLTAAAAYGLTYELTGSCAGRPWRLCFTACFRSTTARRASSS